MNWVISGATRKNWERLQVTPSNRLAQRANKTQSLRSFIPTECLDNSPLSLVEYTVHLVQQEKVTTENALFSLACNQIDKITNQQGKEWFYIQYPHCSINTTLFKTPIPRNYEFLGVVYQALLTEGAKNQQGSYYTPHFIAKTMTNPFIFDKEQTFLDPACGGGIFLLSLTCNNPNLLYGMDIDPIAVMITRANLLFKYGSVPNFIPNVTEGDFLAEPSFFDEDKRAELSTQKFDYIATNPPWGSVKRSGLRHTHLFTDEFFSCFLYKSLTQLKKDGVLSFLLPSSFLNVKNHSAIRKHIRQNFRLKEVTSYSNLFSSVTTEFLSVLISNQPKQDTFTFFDKNKTRHTIAYSNTDNDTISFNSLYDNVIIEQMQNKGKYTLKDSLWGLGIVTGDNKSKLFNHKVERSEPIYTGKEVSCNFLLPPKKYVIYNRTQLQQVAKEEIYRAKEKLIYKFISKKLSFAYDDKQSLCLNSANILIPYIPILNIKVVMAFLNSTLFQFVYQKSFNQIKVLKSNLCELQFPSLTSQENQELLRLIGNRDQVDKWIYRYYNITEQQQTYIEKEVG